MEGIVVSKIKYNDYTLIINLISEENGKKAYLKTISKKGKEQLFFEPLSLIEFNSERKSSNGWGRIKESKLLYRFPKKNPIIENCIRYFISEFLFLTVHEEENIPLFKFLKNFVFSFSSTDYSVLLLDFLFEIAPLKGLYIPEEKKPYFDLTESEYSLSQPGHKIYLNKDELEAINNYVTKDKLSKLERRNTFQAMFKFYKFHFENLQRMKSLDVLKEILG